MNRVPSGKKLRARLRHAYARGRLALLAMVAVTLVNQLLLGLGVEYHFLLSAAAPYYLNWTCREMGVTNGICAGAAVLTAVLYGAYVVCWLLSGRHRGWLTAALGLYAVDTLLLIFFALTLLENAASCILEIITHGGVLVLLMNADRAAARLSRLPKLRRVPCEISKKEGTYHERQYCGQAVPGISGKSDQVSPV